MRPVRLIALAATLVPLAAPAPALAEFRRITEEQAYVAAVAGRLVVSPAASMRIRRDWTYSGRLADGSPVSGAWTWDSGYFCFNERGNRSRTFCQVIYLDARRLLIVPDRGRGEAFLAEIM